MAAMTGHRILSGTDARLRIAPWRGDTRTAHLTPGRGRPTPAAIARALDELAAGPYGAALTAALPAAEQRPFLDAGFEVHERLHLLVRGLDDLPTVARAAGRPAARATTPTGPRVLAVDAAAFPPFWRLDGPGLEDALAATPTARLRVGVGRRRPTAVVGYAVTGRAGPRGYLQRLAVDPAAQGAGIGAALVVDGLRWLRRWGAKEVLVNTQEGNAAGRPPLRAPRLPAPARRPGRAPPGPRRGLLVPLAPRRRPRRGRSSSPGCSSPPSARRRRRRPTGAAAPRRGAADRAGRARPPSSPPGGTFAVRLAPRRRPRRRQHPRGRPPARALALGAGPVDGGRGAAQPRCFQTGHVARRARRRSRTAPAGSPCRSTPPAAASRCATEGVYPVELIAQDAAGTALATLDHPPHRPAGGGRRLAAAGRRGGRRGGRAAGPPARRHDRRCRAGDVEDMAELVAGLRGRPRRARHPRRDARDDRRPARPPPSPATSSWSTRSAPPLPGGTVMALPYVAVEPGRPRAGRPARRARPSSASAGARCSPTRSGCEPSSAAWMAPPRPRGRRASARSRSAASTGSSCPTTRSSRSSPASSATRWPSRSSSRCPTTPRRTRPRPRTCRPSPPTPWCSTGSTPPGSPGLVASRVLASWPSCASSSRAWRGASCSRSTPGTPAAVVQLILEGLGSGRPFAPMGLDAAFDHATPLLDGGGNQVDRPLAAGHAPTPIPDAVGRCAHRRARRRSRPSSASSAPTAPAPSRSPATCCSPPPPACPTTTGATHLDAVESAIDAVTSQRVHPATFTLTLTAREGTIPLTIRNDSGMPRARVDPPAQPEARVPRGRHDRPRAHRAESTRIDIAVRSRASGAFPLQIDVGRRTASGSLATTRYTVRSTAVSGAGLVLSVGAGLFLVVWWARHWQADPAQRQARRGLQPPAPRPVSRRATRFRRHGRSPHRHRQQLRPHRRGGGRPRHRGGPPVDPLRQPTSTRTAPS